ncbi:hypothetical protein BD769DRAFT_1638475 [Suillus cothurnatus]|nr:hypothetical protein BD769DRAFT_1638475 [Suillus cothurnatus]
MLPVVCSLFLYVQSHRRLHSTPSIIAVQDINKTPHISYNDLRILKSRLLPRVVLQSDSRTCIILVQYYKLILIQLLVQVHEQFRGIKGQLFRTPRTLREQHCQDRTSTQSLSRGLPHNHIQQVRIMTPWSMKSMV